MEVALWRATRIRTLPRDVVMARKMFKAAKNAFTPADNVMMSIRVGSLVKFPSPVMFAIVLERSKKLKSLLRSLLVGKSLCQMQLNVGLRIDIICR